VVVAVGGARSAWIAAQATCGRRTGSTGGATRAGVLAAAGNALATQLAGALDDGSDDAGLIVGERYGFTAAERTRIRAFTGADVGPDGMIDFTTGGAAGHNIGRIPQGCTSFSICMGGWGSVVWFGAVGPHDQAQAPCQQVPLRRGTLTGMQIQFEPDATAQDRSQLLSMALGYVHALNFGEDKSWAPGAILPTTAADAAAERRRHRQPPGTDLEQPAWWVDA
jgi:hypothetical protein